MLRWGKVWGSWPNRRDRKTNRTFGQGDQGVEDAPIRSGEEEGRGLQESGLRATGEACARNRAGIR